MIIYSAFPPVLEGAVNVVESVSEVKNGIPSFYEKSPDGKRILKFSTDPKIYLERGRPLQ